MPSPLCPLCRLPFDPKKVDKATHVEKQLSSYKAPCRGCNKKVPALLGSLSWGALGGAASPSGFHFLMRNWVHGLRSLSVEPHLLQCEATCQILSALPGSSCQGCPTSAFDSKPVCALWLMQTLHSGGDKSGGSQEGSGGCVVEVLLAPGVLSALGTPHCAVRRTVPTTRPLHLLPLFLRTPAAADIAVLSPTSLSS